MEEWEGQLDETFVNRDSITIANRWAYIRFT